MRIDCEQCGAAYAIDDSLISERGVRAQCPKCGAQKVVKSDESAAAPPPSGAPFGDSGPSPFGSPGESPSPFASAPPAASSFGGSPAASPFGGAPSPFGTPSAPPPGGADPFASTAPAGPPPSPFGGGPSPAGADPFASAPPEPAAPPPDADPFAAGAEAPAPGPDPFAALGAGQDEDPFARLGGGDDGGGESQPAEDSGGLWQLKPKGGELESNVTLEQLRERVRTGKVGPSDEAALMGAPLRPVRDNPVLAVSLPKNIASTRKATGASAAGAGGLPKPLIAVLALAVLAVGGYAAMQLKPDSFEARTEAGVNPFRRAKAQWSMQFPDVEGTSDEHVVEGRKQMRTDTASGYRKADEHFRMALLLDVGNLNAIAGYVENFAQLPNVKADPDGVTLAFDGIEWALQQASENPSLLRALGALRLATGEVDAAQKVLVKAERLAPDDAVTKLLLARTHLERSVDDALALVKTVNAMDPELKQTLLVAGAAERRLGNYQEARALLQQRLDADPGNVAALKEMARLELDLGNGRPALTWLDRLLEAEEQDVDAHLLRAQITYQVLGDLQRADGRLKFVLDGYEKVAGELLLPVLTHAAFVKAELGALEEAQQLGERARGLSGSYAPAHYVLGRIYAKTGDFAAAEKSFGVAVQQILKVEPLYEPLARAQLGDVLMAAGKPRQARREYSRVIEYAPRSVRGYLGLAAVHMAEGRPSPAFTVMRKVIDIDPRQESERLSLTDYPSSRSDLVGYAEAFAKGTSAEANRPLKNSSEGIIRYHAGQRGAARALFSRAIKDDRYNHPALLYVSVMDWEDGKLRGVRQRLKRAVDTTAGSHTITQLYLARAELSGGKLSDAQKRLTTILDSEPTLVQARYSLGQSYLKDNAPEKALVEWRKILEDAPDYLPVKQSITRLREKS